MRRALLVGIDAYPTGTLTGCENDARKMKAVLSRNQDGSPNFDCQLVLGSNRGGVTRPSLRQAIRELLEHPADVALLHFSGHGAATATDGFLVTQDAVADDEGVSMADVLNVANRSPASEIVVVLDCCYSGQFGAAGIVNKANAILREGISILVASRADQPAVEVGGEGVFTSLLVDALEGGAADLLGHVTAPGIYSFAEAALGAWDQRPLFKAHVSKVLPLRHCRAPVPRELLTELPTLFPLPAEDLSLDPSYEESSGKADPAKAKIFGKLQQLNRVHLVVPVGATHMYHAAVESAKCKLTPTGLYYWRLANAGRI